MTNFKKPYKGKKGGKPDHRNKDRKKYPPKPKGNPNLWGMHAVNEAWLNPAREIQSLFITDKVLVHFEETIQKGKAQGIDRPEPKILSKHDLDRMIPKTVHQGLAVECGDLPEFFVQDFIGKANAKDHSTIVVLDQVTDPHNVGAIMRSASALGADGIIMQSRHAPDIEGVLAKAACGAAEHLPVAYETNLRRAIEHLKDAGFMAIALDERGEKTINDHKPGGKNVLVLGAEGKGLRPSIREQCDITYRLPTSGPIQSLNVSNAAAIALYSFKI